MQAIKLTTAALLAALALSTAAAYAADGADDDPRPERGHHLRMPSLERMAMGNALTAELAARSGRTPTEIQALLKEGGPRKTAEALGLDREATKAAMRAAREKVIAQALQAQMITAEQAQTLKDAPMVWTHAGKGGRVRIEAPDEQ